MSAPSGAPGAPRGPWESASVAGRRWPGVSAAPRRADRRNCAWNALTTVTRLRTNQIFASSPDAAEFSRTLMNEVVAVARAKGLAVPADTADDLLRQVREVGGAGLPSSMMMDNEAGRATEVEVILGTPMREGQRLGVPVPIITTLYTIVRALDWRNAHPDEAKFP